MSADGASIKEAEPTIKTNRYVSVSIPFEIIEQIDNVITSKKMGYDSRPEFIKDAVRRRLEEIAGGRADFFTS